jgi:capsular polysaccharide export protein
VPPRSVVLDDLGIYYDATRPSRLERILAEKPFSEAERRRGETLARLHVERRLSKYRLGGGADLPAPDGRRRVLVCAQVEDDASIRLGTIDLRSNAELLQAVRSARPDACLAFKTHPDVVAGLRRGRVAADILGRCADAVVDRADIVTCLDWADEVHVLTSLAGFEALLRGKAVTVWGMPFYAGWGLTDDRHACPRRGRRLSLGELVHGVLVDYPRYLDPATGWTSTPEWTMAALALAPPASGAGRRSPMLGRLPPPAASRQP